MITKMMEAESIHFYNDYEKNTNRYMCLPDSQDGFNERFFNSQTLTLINRSMLSKRILGLSSYLGDLKELLPDYDETSQEYYEIFHIPMSIYQLQEYETIRQMERSMDSNKNMKNKGDNINNLYKTSSNYRIYSRSFCNFVFPKIDGKLGRPILANIKDNAGINITEETIDDDIFDRSLDRHGIHTVTVMSHILVHRIVFNINILP